MSGPKFFQTGMGRVFYEATMPSIARSLEALAKHAIAAPADREAQISMLAATIAAGLATRENGHFRGAEVAAWEAVEIAFEIEKCVASKLCGDK